MSKIVLKDTAEGDITTPATDKFALFVDAGTLKVKDDAGDVSPVGASLVESVITSNVAEAVHNTLYIAGTGGLTVTLPEGSTSDFINAISQMHFEGADGSTTFNDACGNTWTTTGTGTEIDTAQYKFGASSISFNGSGQIVWPYDAGIHNLGTGDFTIEAWYRWPSAVPTSGNLFVQRNGGEFASVFIQFSGTSLQLYVGNGGSNWWVSGTTGVHGMSADTWNHIALVRYGTSVKLYVNGTAIISATISAGNTIYPVSGRAFSFNGDGAANGRMTCWVDEFRFLKGVAAYTANFTPPAAAFSDSLGGAGPHPTVGTTIGISAGAATPVTVDANGGLVNRAATLSVTTAVKLKYVSDEIQWVQVP